MSSPSPALTARLRALIKAAKAADWGQVIANGGPPCFHLERAGKFCLRAKRWEGHQDRDDYPFHRYVSLDALLVTEGQPQKEHEDNAGLLGSAAGEDS